MKWLLVFLLWATLFAVPCTLVSGAYHRGLAQVVTGVFAVVGQGVEIEEIEVSAPFDLAIFAAMCLATGAAPWVARRRALAIGLPVMLAVEVLSVASGIAVSMLWRDGSPQLATGMRLTGYVIETIPWVGAAATWLLLLGPWALPIALMPARTRGARGGKRFGRLSAPTSARPAGGRESPPRS